MRGANQLAALAKRMQEAGRGDLRREMVKTIRAEVKPVVEAQRRQVRGLAHAPSEWKSDSARAVKPKVLTSLKSAGVRITVGGGDVGRHAKHLNRGRWRHPLFGNKDDWFEQKVEPGWFDKPATAGQPRIRKELIRMMGNYLARLASGRTIR